MCEKGNQTVYQACADKIKAAQGGKPVSNQAMREIIAKNGGCLTSR